MSNSRDNACSLKQTKLSQRRDESGCVATSQDGVDVVICLSKRDMLQTAARRGVDEPIYMGATHGMQKYGLKLVTVHVKDEEDKGATTPDSGCLQFSA
jgi:putative ribosome biogenesis GTPase RsgA